MHADKPHSDVLGTDETKLTFSSHISSIFTNEKKQAFKEKNTVPTGKRG